MGFNCVASGRDIITDAVLLPDLIHSAIGSRMLYQQQSDLGT